MRRRSLLVRVFLATVLAILDAEFNSHVNASRVGIAAFGTSDSRKDLVNIKEFGAIGNGSTDDTVAIQAAIDYAYNHVKQTVVCPAGIYRTTTSLFLDAPKNLRGSYAAWFGSSTYSLNDVVTYAGVPWISLAPSNTGNTPSVTSSWWAETVNPSASMAAFSLSLVGESGGMANHEGSGCNIKPTFNNGAAIWMGPGRGMAIRGIQLSGPSGGYRGNQNINGIGIAQAANGSRYKVEDTYVENFYTCAETGADGANLDDSISFVKDTLDNCYQGIYVRGNQNDIIDLQEMNIGATIAVQNGDSGRQITVVGGNYSAESQHADAYAINSPSALSNTNTMTAVISSPNSDITSCRSKVGNCILNSWIIVTPDFGPVPLTMTAYNTSARTGTFQVNNTWASVYFNTDGVYGEAYKSTQLNSELRAATTIYGVERIFTFFGSTVDVVGAFVENPGTCTTFFTSTSGFGVGTPSAFKDIFFNYDPGLSTLGRASTGTGDYGRLQCQRAFPFIEFAASGGSTQFENFGANQSNSDYPVTIDVDPNYHGTFYFGINSLFSPNVRNARNFCGSCPTWITAKTSNPSLQSYASPDTFATGSGKWKTGSPFFPYYDTNPGAQLPLYGIGNSYLATPFNGWLPDPNYISKLTPTTVTTLTGKLPALSAGGYAPMFGNTLYFNFDWNTGAPSTHFVTFGHEFASWGQNLNVNWSYVGGTSIVQVSGADYKWLFAGLYITLNNGSASVPYLVTGYYPTSAKTAYITVLNLSGGEETWNLLAGAIGTTYAGSTIGQQRYIVTKF